MRRRKARGLAGRGLSSVARARLLRRRGWARDSEGGSYGQRPLPVTDCGTRREVGGVDIEHQQRGGRKGK